MKNLKIKSQSPLTGDIIKFTDWELETIDFLDKHKNIKKVWLISDKRVTGATYFAKLLLYFRKPCTKTFCISHNLMWAKYITRQMPIEFYLNADNKDGEFFRAPNFMTPVSLFGLEKEIEKDKHYIDSYTDLVEKELPNLEYECLYDATFDIKKYNKLCSYDFKFFVISIRSRDLEKAKTFIEQDKDKDDVLIVNINEQLPKLPEW